MMASRILWGCLALALLLCTGCGELPQRDPAQVSATIPAQWTALSSTESGKVQPWLKDFGDASLTALVQAALAGNNPLGALAARVEQARATARIEGAARKPYLDLGPNYSHLGYSRFTDGNSGSYWELPFNLSWELDVWGRIGDSQQAAGLEADAIQADVAGAVLSLSARTVQACFELAQSRQQVQVVEQSIAERSTLVELVRGRFKLGLTTGLDLSLALTDLNDAKAELEASRNQVQVNARALDLLLGRYPEGRQAGCETLPELPPPLPAGVPAELLARRPDVTAAFTRLRSQDHRLSSAHKALLPRVTLYAGAGTAGRAISDLADPRSAAWNILLGLAQPVYAGGRLYAEIDLNQARVEEETRKYRETVLNAFREVEQSLAAEALLDQQKQSLTDAVKQTETSRKLAIHSYRNGSLEILTLLDSYRSTLTARSALLSAQGKLLNNRIDLYLALGGQP